MTLRGITAVLLMWGASVAVAKSPATNVLYTGEVVGVMRGGVERDSVYLGNLDVDVDYPFGPDGEMRAYVYFLGNHGGDPSLLVGDTQVVSNIEAPRSARVYEAWIEGDLLGVNLKVGLYDLNSEFDVIDAASLFAHSSFGTGADFSQAGLTGPSIFPVTGLGIRVFKDVGDNYLQMAVIDGVPGDPDDLRKTSLRVSRHDGALIVSEFGRTGELVDGGSFKLAAGIWHFSARYENHEGSPERGNQGVYLLGERLLVQSGSFELVGFARLGMADDSINAIDTYAGGGLVAGGFLSNRPQDRMGIAFARAGFSDQWRQIDGRECAETAIEWSYELAVAGWLTLQPYLQYVVNPSGDPSLDDAVIAGLRFSIAYSP